MALAYWPSPAEFTHCTLRTRRPRRALAETGPRKPVHLDGRVRAIAVKSAGPALSIERAERRTTLPLGRIARIQVIGRVTWEAQAIAQCLQARIPIVFLDLNGTATGAALPIVAGRGDLNELLERFVDDPRWSERYENWLRAQRAMLFLWWRRRCRMQGLQQQPWLAQQQRAFVYRCETQWLAPTYAEAYGSVLAVLLRAGVGSQFRSVTGGTLPLAKDLAVLAAARVQLERGALGVRLGEHPWLLARANAVALPHGDEYIVLLLRKLHKLVGQYVEPWA